MCTAALASNAFSAVRKATAKAVTMYSGKSPAPIPSPATFDESASRVPDDQYPIHIGKMMLRKNYNTHHHRNILCSEDYAVQHSVFSRGLGKQVHDSYAAHKASVGTKEPGRL